MLFGKYSGQQHQLWTINVIKLNGCVYCGVDLSRDYRLVGVATIRLLSTGSSPELAEGSRSTPSHATSSSRPKGSSLANHDCPGNRG